VAVLIVALTAWQRIAAVVVGAALVWLGGDLTTAGTAVLCWALPWPGDVAQISSGRRKLAAVSEAVRDAPEAVRRRVRESVGG
jgi:hypothetical protein